MQPDFSSFSMFVQTTNGRAIGTGECWDYINLLWAHLGSRYWTYPPSDPSATNHGVKWGWLNTEARAANTINHLSQITSLSQIKPGDVVVTSGGTYGHAGFAAETYDGSGYLYAYSQNFDNRRSVARDHLNMSTFVGAWRYDAWNGQPTPEPIVNVKTNFKWVLYVRKLRQRQNNQM